MELSVWVAIGAAVVSLLSFLDRIASRKNEATTASIRAVDSAWKEEYRLQKEEWDEELRLLRTELDQRLASLNARILEQSTQITQIKLDVVTGTANVPTREDLGNAITAALRPMNQHMDRVDRFMEAAYTSGVFVKRD